ncbi:YoaK family protein [Streptomyces sp. NPDC002896]|uniref:YoaK family protein n=1 Tax=Streptomyces sp. NPDC002896 TaxID=3154438 RepID=UPI0033329978
MRALLLRVSDRMFPHGTNTFGAVPALLVLLTVVTGIVDAVSYLGLGHVFVANMTGNVVFLGFAVAGAGGLSAWASALAIGAFVLGAWSTGRLHLRALDPQRVLVRATAVHAVLVAIGVAVAGLAGQYGTVARAVLIALLAGGMGLQNAAVRKLAVPELSTTVVLTSTLTGLAADAPGFALLRRVCSVAAMIVGAVFGGLLHLRAGPASALGLAVVPLVIVAAIATRPRAETP